MVLFTGTQAEQQPSAETVASQVTEAHKVSYRSHDLQSACFAGGLVLGICLMTLAAKIAFFQGH